jgi:hypothetical protein
MTSTTTRRHPRGRGRVLSTAVAVILAIVAFWGDVQGTPLPSGGKDIFRFDTFGNETFWTDTLRLHEAIATAVDPTTALSVG